LPEGQGLVCFHAGSNTLNLYVAWLVFDMDRVVTGFANSFRVSNNTDVDMVDAAINATLFGDFDCESRIASKVYTTSVNSTKSPVHAPTSAPVKSKSGTSKHRGLAGWFSVSAALLLLGSF
jgi:hypothetical protein